MLRTVTICALITLIAGPAAADSIPLEDGHLHSGWLVYTLGTDGSISISDIVVDPSEQTVTFSVSRIIDVPEYDEDDVTYPTPQLVFAQVLDDAHTMQNLVIRRDAMLNLSKTLLKGFTWIVYPAGAVSFDTASPWNVAPMTDLQWLDTSRAYASGGLVGIGDTFAPYGSLRMHADLSGEAVQFELKNLIIPEPASLALLAMAAWLLPRRRPRNRHLPAHWPGEEVNRRFLLRSNRFPGGPVMRKAFVVLVVVGLLAAAAPADVIRNLVDPYGVDSGWSATVSNTFYTDITTDRTGSSYVSVEVFKRFPNSADGGPLSPNVISFTQRLADASTRTNIRINDETIRNNTTVGWTSYVWHLDGGGAAFDRSATESSGWTYNPFTRVTWLDSIGTSLYQTVVVDTGVVAPGGIFSPGYDRGFLQIHADLTRDNSNFTLTQYPVPEPAMMSLLGGGFALAAFRRRRRFKPS